MKESTHNFRKVLDDPHPASRSLRVVPNAKYGLAMAMLEECP
jgi:hypothetical protein